MKNRTTNKEIIHTAPNGKKYSISIRKYTPRDCFRLMGVHEADIDKLLSKEKDGSPIICKSKLYALAGNSIVTNCLTAMFEELISHQEITITTRAVSYHSFSLWIFSDILRLASVSAKRTKPSLPTRPWYYGTKATQSSGQCTMVCGINKTRTECGSN